MNEAGSDHDEATVSPEDGQSLLNELFRLAPQSFDKGAEALMEEGWESFFTYRPVEPSGSANVYDIRLALGKIKSTVPTTSGDWVLMTVKDEKDPTIFHLLKRPTQQRVEWDQQQAGSV